MSLLKRDSNGEKPEKEFSFGRKSKKPVVTIEDAYDSNEGRLSANDAHRNSKYDLAPVPQQIITAYMTQMKRFTKERTIWVLLILLIMIPVIYVPVTSTMGFTNSHITNIYMAGPLIALPIISMYITSNVCGSMLPREFNERTVYLSLPLPMSRFSFYIGKFLAGFTLCAGVVTAAYGISILLAMIVGHTDASYSGAMFGSLLVALTSTFAFCGFIYMLSASSKRGSTMKGLTLLLVLIPALVFIVKFLPEVEALSSLKGILNPIGNILLYLPVFGPDLAINNLGLSCFGETMGINSLSLIGLLNGTFFGGNPITINIGIIEMSLVAIVIGTLCIYRGYKKIERRDM